MRYPQSDAGKKKGVVQIAEVANGIMDPVLSKRAGINTMLLGSWDEIAGEDFADCTRPEKIAWPRRASEIMGEGGHQPGVLAHADHEDPLPWQHVGQERLQPEEGEPPERDQHRTRAEEGHQQQAGVAAVTPACC